MVTASCYNMSAFGLQVATAREEAFRTPAEIFYNESSPFGK